MLKVTIEGVYESDVGSGQKKFESFNYTFKTSRITEKGLETHVLRRFIPALINNDKSKKLPYSRVKNFVITDIQKINDDKDCIINKDINELNAWQIQDLAAVFDLYEIPAGNTCSISQLREKAILAYLKKVIKIPMNTTKEKEQTEFLVKQPNGTYKLDLNGNKVTASIPEGYFETETKEVTKKGLDYFLHKAGVLFGVKTPAEIASSQAGANTEIASSQAPRKDGVGSQRRNVGGGNSPFPSQDDLIQQ